MFSIDETMATLGRLDPLTRRILAEYCYAESVEPWHGVGERRMLRALAQASESVYPVAGADHGDVRLRLTGRSPEHHATLSRWTDLWLQRGSSIDLLALATTLAA